MAIKELYKDYCTVENGKVVSFCKTLVNLTIKDLDIGHTITKKQWENLTGSLEYQLTCDSGWKDCVESTLEDAGVLHIEELSKCFTDDFTKHEDDFCKLKNRRVVDAAQSLFVLSAKHIPSHLSLTVEQFETLCEELTELLTANFDDLVLDAMLAYGIVDE